jgi:predicted ArsR family transcriptional regulator
MGETPLEAQAGVLSALADPIRRALYEFVVDQGGGVTREEAGVAAGVSRPLAAYHLDRLVEEGVLVSRSERRGTRRGPGQGRPTKVYDRAPTEVHVSLPARDYEVAARLFARAFEDPGTEPRVALTRAARALGTEIGTEAARRAGSRASTRRRQECLRDVLRERGYEPFDESGRLRLRNCPFHALAAEHRELVCGMNLDLLSAVVSGLGADLEVVLDPRPGQCCVAIGP